MTKYQKEFYDYLCELEKLDEQNKPDRSYKETALKEFFKYWKMYEVRGINTSLQLAMSATIAFVGYPCKAHTN